MEDCLHITLQFPVRSSVDVVISKYDSVSSLDEKMQLPKRRLVLFNNMLLSPNFSFNFYNIPNYSKLFIFPLELPMMFGQSQDDTRNSGSSFRSRTPPPPKVTIDTAKGPSEEKLQFPQEIARIKDQFFQKVEGTVMCHRKLLHRFTRMMDNDSDKSSDSPVVIPKASDEPSTKILPMFWTENSDGI